MITAPSDNTASHQHTDRDVKLGFIDKSQGQGQTGFRCYECLEFQNSDCITMQCGHRLCDDCIAHHPNLKKDDECTICTRDDNMRPCPPLWLNPPSQQSHTFASHPKAGFWSEKKSPNPSEVPYPRDAEGQDSSFDDEAADGSDAGYSDEMLYCTSRSKFKAIIGACSTCRKQGTKFYTFECGHLMCEGCFGADDSSGYDSEPELCIVCE